MKKPGLWQKFSNLVSDSSPLMTWVGQVALLAVCNLCWLVCSLPVITTGAATTALYAVLLERRGMSFDAAFTTFFRAFRRCFRTATVLWLPALALGAAWVWSAWLTVSRGLTNNAFALLPLLVSGAIWIRSPGHFRCWQRAAAAWDILSESPFCWVWENCGGRW